MITPKLTLAAKQPTAANASSDAVKDAAKRKAAATETVEDAWHRILAMKNTDVDNERLQTVRKAIMTGEIGRRPSDVAKRFSKAEALRMWAELNEKNREETLRRMVAETPDNYELITDDIGLERVIDLLRQEQIIALDTETTGVDVYADEIVGISISFPIADYHVYIPVAHTEGPQLNSEYVLKLLQPFLEDEAIGKVLHNAKFDIHMLMRHGVRMRGLVHDTMIAMHVLDENEDSFALKNLATKYLGEPSDTFSTLFGRNAKFAEVPLDVALVYAAKDTHITWKLYEFQRKHFDRLPKLRDVYDKIENPLIDVVIDMERTGFVLDKEYADGLADDLREQLRQVEIDLRVYFGEINLNSPVQLKPAIEALVGRSIDSTDVNTLKGLSSEHDGIAVLLKYRELSKLLGTYIEALPLQVKQDGRIHASFNQMGTVTGRFSSQNPNFQNQPKFARKLFVAPPGYVMLAGDFSQQEPRLLAHFSQETVLLDAYRANKDLYTTAAAELFNLPESECGDGSKYRKMLKTGILAVMYGTGPKTLAGQLGISEQEAKDFIAQFYAKYPRVKAWIDGNEQFAKKNAFVEMLYGRKRRLPEVKSRDRGEQFRALRQATNAIVQGSAAIQTKLTMLALDALCKRKGWQMAFSIHDEIAIYCQLSTLTLEDVKEFESVMLETVKLSVPNKSDLELSLRWGEGRSVKEWFSDTK